SMSARFAAVVESLSSRVEQYSIDELFVDCRGMETAMNLEAFGHQLRREVQRHTTLTCGVGVSFTKTLAKLCNHAAKTWPATRGVVALTDERRLHKLMAILPAAEVWGVGRRISARLETMGIRTALDLMRADTRFIRSNFSVTLERTVRELRGEICFGLDENPATKQQIGGTAEFGKNRTLS
ncbi:TPA: DNA polymerase V subunit UmuC, partial [Klebsiella pneumoniae]|nr:DNA polymerase V subunit UmuC [Klebsiella pneumoniae]HBS8058198.1 DNA polymerase V subunit UmuC [Klebsiella pneumoniae]HBS8584598.1 DNA polymerase V subunit UmuC [Klebsiella pneumoniae]HBS8601123.1 DNA polymerase V subunit UmuC [Klebsiella pneumoniae]HBS8606724.1 DNA polymerase V subunit UmuC [Klebsiella pneumoniae]